MRALPLTGVLGQLTRRLAAITLIGQAMVIGFGALVARGFAVAEGNPQAGATYLVVGGAFVFACLLTAGLLRWRYGVTLGWLLQSLTLASALVLPAMVLVALVFGALWTLCLVQGQKVAELSWPGDPAARHTAPQDDREPDA